MERLLPQPSNGAREGSVGSVPAGLAERPGLRLHPQVVRVSSSVWRQKD